MVQIFGNSYCKNQSYRFITVLLLFFAFNLASVGKSMAQYQNTSKLITKTINSNIKGYQESLPVDYASNPNKKYPLLIFIHGKGEVGDGSQAALAKIAKVGLGYTVASGKFPATFTVNGESFSFIVVSPQLVTSDYTNAGTYIGSLIDYCIKTYRVDESRIYLTGLSMGGGITWRYAAAQPKRLAAIVPICGSVSGSAAMINNIASSNLPVWATHNSGDNTINVSITKNWISSLSDYSPKMNPQPLMTIFETTGHNAWSKTYDVNFKVNKKNIFEWMLSYKRSSTSTDKTPTANAGSDKTITLPTNSVTLDGSNSSTPSGTTISSYSWAKTSGGAATISNGSTSKATVKDLVAGTYTFTLTVTNSAGLKSTSTVTVTVKEATNQSPVAKAGSAQTITLPANSVTLDGSGSTTPAGTTITSYTWAKESGGAATISSASSAKTTVTGLVEGTYSFTLTVVNSAGLKSVAKVSVVVVGSSSTPVVNTGPSQTITLPTNSVSMDGSGSTTPAGTTITSYKWMQTSGGNAKITSPSSAKTTITGLEEGTYIFKLTVTNSAGLSSSGWVAIKVMGAAAVIEKLPPITKAGSDKTITLPTNSVTLDGSASEAQQGRIISYAWKQVSGPSATIVSPDAAKTSVKDLVKGSYVFSLTVTSDNGKRSTDEVSVTVLQSSGSTGNNVVDKEVEDVVDKVSPIANAGTNKSIILPTNSVTLDGSKSAAQVGRLISYEWKKVSGGAATIVSPSAAKTSVTGLVQGVYVFSLKVTSDNGKRSTAEVQVTVSAASGRQAGISTTEVISSTDAEDVTTNTVNSQLTLSAAPNPAVNNVTLAMNSAATGKASVLVYNMQGGLVLQDEFNKSAAGSVTRDINISRLTSGIYIINVRIGAQITQSIRIVKQ